MNVLIFDDSPSAVLDAQLKVNSVIPSAQIHRALNYDTAADILKNHNIDLALIDLSMPEKNGMDFISDFIQPHPEFSKTPIIVVTAVKSASILSAALDGAVSSYLVKPVSPLELQSSIRKALRTKLESIE